MDRMRRRRRHGAPVLVVAVLALLTACSPPEIGAVTLARHPDGGAVAVIILCRGSVTELELTHGPADEPTEGEPISWSGNLSKTGVTGIRLTDADWEIVPDHQYSIRGGGDSDDEALGFLAGEANLRSESQIDGSTLARLAPGEVVSWDAATQRSVAVPLDEFREGVCAD